MVEETTNRVAHRIFYSYSHKDTDLRDRLEKHLTILRRQGRIQEWHDRHIKPGDEWREGIDKNLEDADLILLLISADFLASDYCYDTEMRRALEMHETGQARVIPILLRPVDWQEAPFSHLQLLPTGAVPVVQWPDQDAAWTHVVQGIRMAIQELEAAALALPAALLATSPAPDQPLQADSALDSPTQQTGLVGRDQDVAPDIAALQTLLQGDELALFRRLAVFAGGCTLGAARAVCTSAGDPGLDVLTHMAALVDKNVVRALDRADDEPRFVMPEQLREHGLERLRASREYEPLRRYHADYYLTVVERAEPDLRGPQQATWLERLEAEHDNLRAALQWARHAGEVELGLRLAGAAWPFWHRHNHLLEGREWLEGLLARADGAHAPSIAPGVNAKALLGAGVLAYSHADYGHARARLEDSWMLCRRLGDTNGIAAALNNLVLVARDQGDRRRADALQEQVQAVLENLRDGPDAARSLNNLGLLARDQGHYQRASELHQQSLIVWRRLGDLRSIAGTLIDLGIAAQALGHYGEASASLKESLALLRELGDKVLSAWCLEGLGAIAGAMGDPERLARLSGAADGLRSALRIPLPLPDRHLYERCIGAARAALGEGVFAAAWAQGRSLLWEQAVVEALDNS